MKRSVAMSISFAVVVGSLLVTTALGSGNAFGSNFEDFRDWFRNSASRISVHTSDYGVCDWVRSHCIYWLDNDRVIFRGSRPGETSVAPGRQPEKVKSIYIWDLRSGTTKPYVEGDIALLCYDNNFVRYTKVEGGTRIDMAGMLQEEIVLKRSNAKENDFFGLQQEGWADDLSCGRNIARFHAAGGPGVKMGLKEGHGYVAFGRRSPEATIHLFSSPSSSAIELPLRRGQLLSSDVTPSFNGSYLLKGYQIPSSGSTCVPEGFQQKVYRLWPDGRVITVTLPYADEIRCYLNNPHSVHDVRTGMTISMNNPRKPGLYHVANKSVTQLLRGWIGDAAVSPDGCRLALGITTEWRNSPSEKTSWGRPLKVVDFCKKEKQ